MVLDGDHPRRGMDGQLVVSVWKSTLPAFKCLDTLYNHMLILFNSEILTKIVHIMECCLLIIASSKYNYIQSSIL